MSSSQRDQHPISRQSIDDQAVRGEQPGNYEAQTKGFPTICREARSDHLNSRAVRSLNFEIAAPITCVPATIVRLIVGVLEMGVVVVTRVVIGCLLGLRLLRLAGSIIGRWRGCLRG